MTSYLPLTSDILPLPSYSFTWGMPSALFIQPSPAASGGLDAECVEMRRAAHGEGCAFDGRLAAVRGYGIVEEP